MSVKKTLQEQIDEQKEKARIRARKDRARIAKLKRKEAELNKREIFKELSKHDVKTLADFKSHYQLIEAPTQPEKQTYNETPRAPENAPKSFYNQL